MTTNNPDVVLDELYNAEFPRHERTSCSDEDPSNASPDGFGCKRCNAIIHVRAERLQAECDLLRKHLQNLIDQTTPLEPVPGNPMWSRRIQLDEVLAERDQLRAEREQLRRRARAAEREYSKVARTLKGLDRVAKVVSDHSDEACTEYNQLRVECEKLRRDAERYQWLREQNAKPADECSGLASIAVVFDDDDGGVWVGACLDTAIDEAMQEPSHDNQ